MPKPPIGKDKPNEIYIKALLFVKPFALRHRWENHFLTKKGLFITFLFVCGENIERA